MPAQLSPRKRDALMAAAVAAVERSYATYSGIHVGAAVLLADGSIYAGSNVENSSYGLTVCAERTAVFNAVTAAGPTVVVVAVALASDDPRINTPCGACLQVLHEFGSDALVVLPNGKETSVATLLPSAFDL